MKKIGIKLLSSTLLFNMLAYTFAVMFTNNASRTIPVALKSLIGQLGVDWGLLTTGGIITIIPVCIMFFFAQKRLVEGLTAGAVKG